MVLNTSTKPRALILLSAGLDSLTALSCAAREYEVVLALTFDYGQRAAKREILQARRIAEYYGIPARVIKLDWLAGITKSALVNRKVKIPVIKNKTEAGKQSAAAVWVPNRNGVFLNIGAALAESLSAGTIVVGFNAEEAVTFPDNSLAYCRAVSKSFQYSTANQVTVKNYFFSSNKAAILKIAIKNRAPLELLWSCYAGGAGFCGECESCMRLKAALQKNGLLQDYAKRYKNFRGLL